MIMNLNYILYFICFGAVVTSCNSTVGNNEPLLVRGDLTINFSDYQLDSVIGAYVTRYKVDPKHRILSVNIYRDPVRSLYFITQVRKKKLIENNPPDYFFLHDDRFLVLVQLGGSNFYSSRELLSKVDSAVDQLGIALADDSTDYNPPSWEVIKDCGRKLRMRKQSDFTFNYMPCGYEVKQDSVRLERFSLIKVKGD
jgi:hypothetical protein